MLKKESVLNFSNFSSAVIWGQTFHWCCPVKDYSGSSVIYPTGVCLPPSLQLSSGLPERSISIVFFFFNTFPSNHGQLTRGTRGSASVWSFPKNSGLLIKISSINDSFKPGGHNWKIRHYITLSMIWWSLRRPVVGHLRTPKHQNWERFIIEENPWLKWANFCL